MASLKHGGYSRRVLLPDDVIEYARDLTLYDELLWFAPPTLTILNIPWG